MNAISAFLFACLAAQCFAATIEFSYSEQQNWTGLCISGVEKSPIDITTSNVVVDSSLPNLQFNAWDVSYPGIFENTGHNVQFNPTTPGAATTINQFGTYGVQQFHMHWGRRTGEGSENRINSDQAELEIHFVHYKNGVTDTTQRDYITVVAVLGDVVEGAARTSPWAELNVTQIQSNTTSNISVTGFAFDLLLPNNRDYYYYQGSLTTPPCSETVQWFVLKERIRVPSIFLEQLREVQESNGEILGFNFRDVQSLGNRMVMTASQAINKPFITLLILSLFFTSIF